MRIGAHQHRMPVVISIAHDRSHRADLNYQADVRRVTKQQHGRGGGSSVRMPRNLPEQAGNNCNCFLVILLPKAVLFPRGAGLGGWQG